MFHTDSKKIRPTDMLLVIRCLTLAGLFFGAGCSAGNYGYLKHSRDVAQAFETYHVFPEHRYYYLNQENNPYAVVALQNPYRLLLGNMWTEFDPRSGKLEKVVGLVKDFPVNYSYTYGSIINDPMGKQIGYWYSSLRVISIKVDEENRTVSINTGTPWLQDDHGGLGVGFGVSGSGGGVGIILGP